LDAPQIEFPSQTVLNKQIWWRLQVWIANVAVMEGMGGGGDLRWVDDSREVFNVVHAQIW